MSQPVMYPTNKVRMIPAIRPLQKIGSVIIGTGLHLPDIFLPSFVQEDLAPEGAQFLPLYNVLDPTR